MIHDCKILLRSIYTVILWRAIRFFIRKNVPFDPVNGFYEGLSWGLDIGANGEQEITNFEAWFFNEMANMYYDLQEYRNKRLLLGKI